ncbi:membrane protein [soil metagenome]
MVVSDKYFTFIVFLMLASATESFAQDTLSTTLGKRKGTIYVTWGYNRDWYSESTIHFKNTKTDNYDFTFINAKAHDNPSMERYWQLDRLTIPQYDFTVGYLFNDERDLGIEISWNHLKYVVTDNQIIHVVGNIRGRYIDKDTLVTPDFVHLQHTNGNNYLMVNLVKRIKIVKSKNFQLSAIGKVGAGPLISYTISTILGSVDNGHFHYHGWVAGTSVGLRFNIYKYFFIQSDIQGAFANYTNTELGADRQGLATHHFYSLQWIWAGGLNLTL